MKVDFDNKMLSSLTLPVGKAKLTLTDSRTRGLQFELRRSGGSFSYRYSSSGRQRSIPIGRFGVLKVADARARALELARMVALGEDPLTARRLIRECPTIDDFFHKRYLPFAKVDKRSWQTDVSVYRNHIAPVFGHLRMNEITKGMIREFLHQKVGAGAAKGSANRMLVMIKYFYNLAIDWELDGVVVNPGRGIKPFTENNKIERYLSVDESAALKEALEASHNPLLKYIVAFLLVTGCRKQEALRARWEHVDVENRVWKIPLSKSGKARHVTLSDTAVCFLHATREFTNQLVGADNPFLFPNPRTKLPFINIFYAWNNARKRAGIPSFRIHDARHSYASTLANAGVSLYEIQRLLGHANIRTTERYAHLHQSRLIESASIAGRTFGHLIEQGGKPLAFPVGDRLAPAVPDEANKV
jgi:integrase